MLEKTLLDKALNHIKHGGLRLTYWDGETRTYGHPTSDLHVTITEPGVVKAMIKNLSLGVGEAYMDGRLVVEGPLEELMLLGHRNRVSFGGFNIQPLVKLLHKNTKPKQAEMIQYHYDLGNDFYRLWLDKETLGYTCGYYRSPNDSLEMGQIQKFDHVLRKLQLQPGMRLLDIGFGWGYLLMRAAKQYGAKGLGVSLSQEQLKFAQALAEREGVAELVEFKLMNYQDLPELEQRFDRVVSIGFLEHVGQNNHRIYFDVINRMLVDGGVSVLHCLSQLTEQPMDAWLDRYIFPGTYVPSVREITALLPDYGFYLYDYENIGPHYIPTLRGWWDRFEAYKEQIISQHGERFYRMWRFYLAGCMTAFMSGDLELSQWTFSKGLWLDRPLTREYLYTQSAPSQTTPVKAAAGKAAAS